MAKNGAQEITLPTPLFFMMGVEKGIGSVVVWSCRLPLPALSLMGIGPLVNRSFISIICLFVIIFYLWIIIHLCICFFIHIFNYYPFICSFMYLFVYLEFYYPFTLVIVLIIIFIIYYRAMVILLVLC